MDIKKVLNNIKKKAFKSNIFNLKRVKKAREMTPEEEAFYQQNPDMMENTGVGTLSQQVDAQIENLKVNPTSPIPDEFIRNVLTDPQANIYFQNKLLQEVNVPDVGQFMKNLMQRAAPVIDTLPPFNYTVDPKILEGAIQTQYSTYIPFSDSEKYSLPERAYNAYLQKYMRQYLDQKDVNKEDPNSQQMAVDYAYKRMKVMEQEGDLLRYALGEPQLLNKREGYAPDNRILFFLHHPNHLKPFIDSDPELKDLLAYQLRENMGIDISDQNEEDGILRGLKQAADAGIKSTSSKILLNILNNRLAPQLFQHLADGLDNLDPDIIDWAGKKAFGKTYDIKRQEQKRRTGTPGEEGEFDIFSVLPGTENIQPLEEGDEEDKEEEKENSDMEEYEEKPGEIGKEMVEKLAQAYLASDIEGIENLRDETTQQYVDDTVQRYFSAMGEKEKEAALKEYFLAEKHNVRSIIALDQIKKLLGNYQLRTRVPKSREEYGDFNFLFDNQYGRFSFPLSLVMDILKDVPPDQRSDISRYPEFVKMYKQKAKEGEEIPLFSPTWGNMVNAGKISDAFLNLGKIKTRIRDLWTQNANTHSDFVVDGIKASLERTGELEYAMHFAGVRDYTDPEEAEMMVNNFIRMAPLESQEEVNKLLDYGVRVESDDPEEQAKAKAKTKEHRRQAKALLGDSFAPLLAYLYREVGESSSIYDTSMIRAFYDIMCPQKRFRGFGREGRKKNTLMPEMSNSELSRKIRREDLPDELVYIDEITAERVKAMMGGEKDRKKMGLYNLFFDYHDRTEQIKRSIDYRKNMIESLVEQKAQGLQKINDALQYKRKIGKLNTWLKQRGLQDRAEEIDDFISKSDYLLKHDPEKLEKLHLMYDSPLIKGIRTINAKIRDAREGTDWRKLEKKYKGLSLIPAAEEREGKVYSMEALSAMLKGRQAQKNDPWPSLSIADLEASWEGLWEVMVQQLDKAGYKNKENLPPFRNREIQSAKATYRKMIMRFAKLVKMRDGLVKLSNTDSIDALIRREFSEYNKLFDRLIS